MKMLLIFLFTTLSIFAQGFTLESKDISGQLSQKQVFNGFGCKGDNISPHLSWSNAPKGTKSFAITAYDKDAPTGSGWWHWVMFDVSSNVSTLKRNSGNIKSSKAPKGSIQSLTDFGFKGYGGACPPKGDKAHQYIFTVYALKTKTLGLKSNASPALVGFYINSNMIGKASVIGYYNR